MINFGHANGISTETQRISRNRKSNTARQTSRGQATRNGDPAVASRSQARGGSCAANGERAHGVQLAQTLAREWRGRTSEQARPGRKPKATEAYCLKLEELLSKEPSAYGYRFAIWTSERLRAHLEKETGIQLSEVRFRALLKQKGYRYRRPKHDLSHLQDKVAKKQAEKLLEEMKKRASETISNSSLWTKSA